jgi:hypothetical protein
MARDLALFFGFPNLTFALKLFGFSDPPATQHDKTWLHSIYPTSLGGCELNKTGLQILTITWPRIISIRALMSWQQSSVN